MCFVYYTSILVSALITKSSLDILIGVFFMLIWIFSRCFHYGVGQRNYGGSYWDICILTYRLSGEGLEIIRRSLNV
ncbi:unnamed protein product [Pleuronectes platessa]|uniref:Uncharacterized protein n=1 Tax=Pleuronectes platessa TaxID=8262 RepID=A0A9N7TVZ3_PLEPL|nr:unnamed protein product [Pleuronectes platessa]